MLWRCILGLFAALLLAGCGTGRESSPATPALWEVRQGDEARGWLFGTIHTLPRNTAWRTPVFEDAFGRSEHLVLEIGNPGNAKALHAIFTELSRSSGHPPLAQRVNEDHRPALARLSAKAGLKDTETTNLESWGAALVLAQTVRGAGRGDGVDQALARMAGDRTVIELEGARGQLGLFDALSEAQQRALLTAVLDGADSARDDAKRLFELWRTGAMDELATETSLGILADPQLRKALLVDRNRRWAGQVDGLLREKTPVFIAAGAAHMAGPEGLPALLAQRGWTVVRIQ